jgi:molybdenum cofactor cytidylyltransferase
MITAIVLAAGLSTRMGQSKPLLPFGQRTVIEHILSTLQECPLDAILIVTGHEREALERRLAGWPIRTIFNPQFATGEMLSSIQIGLRSTPDQTAAALIVLGDQPALERSVVEQVVAAYRRGAGSIVIPSHQLRRGHPLLIDRRHWAEILALRDGQTLRDFFREAAGAILHVEVATAGVLRDMDTPVDYRRELVAYLSQQPSEIQNEG